MNDPRIPPRTSGDYADEMERNPFTSDEAEQLLSGRSPAPSEIGGFLRSARSMANTRPDAATEQRHLAAMAEAVHLEPEAGFAPRSRSSVMVGSILRSKVFKTLAGAVAAALAMGGLAAAHTLPAPAQDAMAEVAERVGINLPHADEDDGDDGDAKVKRGADHDGDGVADDNGLHTGQTDEKRGADHDGDGTADDNGLHKGQTKDKRGLDHDGDGTADDNGLRKGDDDGNNGDSDNGDNDDGDDGDDDTDGNDSGPPAVEDRGNSEDHANDNASRRDDDHEPSDNGRGSKGRGSKGD